MSQISNHEITQVGSSADSSTPADDERAQVAEPILTGRAFIAAKAVEYDERLARRRDRVEDDYGPDDMPQVGEVVVHKESGDGYEVVGVKHQGGDRGWSLRIRSLDGDQERHVRPWAVRELDDPDEVEGDELDVDSDDLGSDEVAA